MNDRNEAMGGVATHRVSAPVCRLVYIVLVLFSGKRMVIREEILFLISVMGLCPEVCLFLR